MSSELSLCSLLSRGNRVALTAESGCKPASFSWSELK
jgi:hypothetical protein